MEQLLEQLANYRGPKFTYDYPQVEKIYMGRHTDSLMLRAHWIHWVTLALEVKNYKSDTFKNYPLEAVLLEDVPADQQKRGLLKEDPIRANTLKGIPGSVHSELYLKSDGNRFSFNADIQTRYHFFDHELQSLETEVEQTFSSFTDWDVQVRKQQLSASQALLRRKLDVYMLGKQAVRITAQPADAFWYITDLEPRSAQFCNVLEQSTQLLQRLVGQRAGGHYFIRSQDEISPNKPPLQHMRTRTGLSSVQSVKKELGGIRSVQELLNHLQTESLAPTPTRPAPIKASPRKTTSEPKIKPPKPTSYLTKKDIRAALDEDVIGQEDAKNAVSTAAYLRQLRMKQSTNGVDLPQANVLLVGPTGSGKTHLINTLAKCIDAPLYIADASSLTATGYQGASVDTLLEGLVTEANGDCAQAQQGIVFIDEIDKLAASYGGGTVNTHEVQSELLRVVEGGKYPTSKGIVDTSNVLFIAAGAFSSANSYGISSLEDIVAKRTGQNLQKPLGFVTDEQSVVDYQQRTQEIQPEDLRKYGLKSELIGRFPRRAVLDALGPNELYTIMTKPSNSFVAQVTELARREGVEIDIQDEAMRYVANQAHKDGLGARALQTYQTRIQERLLDDLENEQSFVLDKNRVEAYLSVA